MARLHRSSSPPPGLSPAPGLSQLEDIEKVFARFDADGDGRISASELANVLRALGSDASPEAVRSMINEMDADRDGFVDLREFAEFHGRSSVGEDAELREAFGVYDLDRNGLISPKELHLVLNRLGEKCSVRDCARMIKSVDADGDGNVNFEEFKKMMGKGSNADACVGKRGGK